MNVMSESEFDRSSATAENLGPALLRVEQLHAAYGKKEVLRGVTLHVATGEVVTLLGGNGSGKSTLLKTIAGLLRPTMGTVFMDGVDLGPAASPDRQRLGAGYLLQGGRVFPNLTVAENLEIAARSRYRYADTRVASERVFPILDKLKSDRAGLLSGGQRQMLAIEMVLTQRPRLILLDEPTAALSHEAVTAILAKIREFAHINRSGVLLVEQNVNEAHIITDRHLRMVDGTVVETNSV
jgi:ABC-type branched-subunit amino acid transport system ATPase component